MAYFGYDWIILQPHIYLINNRLFHFDFIFQWTFQKSRLYFQTDSFLFSFSVWVSPCFVSVGKLVFKTFQKATSMRRYLDENFDEYFVALGSFVFSSFILSVGLHLIKHVSITFQISINIWLKILKKQKRSSKNIVSCGVMTHNFKMIQMR